MQFQNREKVNRKTCLKKIEGKFSKRGKAGSHSYQDKGLQYLRQREKLWFGKNVNKFDIATTYKK